MKIEIDSISLGLGIILGIMFAGLIAGAVFG